MKLTTKINLARIVAFIAFISRSNREQTVTNNNDTAKKSNNLRHDSGDINYLKPFDTAFIAYHMMGLSK